MTRNEEYQALLQELETTPAALDGAVERALRRRKRDRRPVSYTHLTLPTIA
mgnify:CR=1 FL=1